MKCVLSQQLMCVTVAFILPVSQKLLATRQVFVWNRQSSGVNNCNRSMREHCYGGRAGLRGAERKIDRVRRWVQAAPVPVFVSIVRG